nr:unnamed protein product [Callosobruchus chinensis]
MITVLFVFDIISLFQLKYLRDVLYVCTYINFLYLQVDELASVGGTKNYNFVKRVLSLVLSDSDALRFSWLERKGKQPFNATNMAKLVICAAEKANIADSRRETENSIQMWLKRAPDRRKGIVKKM